MAAEVSELVPVLFWMCNFLEWVLTGDSAFSKTLRLQACWECSQQQAISVFDAGVLRNRWDAPEAATNAGRLRALFAALIKRLSGSLSRSMADFVSTPSSPYGCSLPVMAEELIKETWKTLLPEAEHERVRACLGFFPRSRAAAGRPVRGTPRDPHGWRGKSGCVLHWKWELRVSSYVEEKLEYLMRLKASMDAEFEQEDFRYLVKMGFLPFLLDLIRGETDVRLQTACAVALNEFLTYYGKVSIPQLVQYGAIEVYRRLMENPYAEAVDQAIEGLKYLGEATPNPGETVLGKATLRSLAKAAIRDCSDAHLLEEFSNFVWSVCVHNKSSKDVLLLCPLVRRLLFSDETHVLEQATRCLTVMEQLKPGSALTLREVGRLTELLGKCDQSEAFVFHAVASLVARLKSETTSPGDFLMRCGICAFFLQPIEDSETRNGRFELLSHVVMSGAGNIQKLINAGVLASLLQDVAVDTFWMVALLVVGEFATLHQLEHLVDCKLFDTLVRNLRGEFHGALYAMRAIFTILKQGEVVAARDSCQNPFLPHIPDFNPAYHLNLFDHREKDGRLIWLQHMVSRAKALRGA